MHAETVAVAVVQKYFPPRRWAVCQNVSWGLLPYEADVIAVSKGGKIHEIEVKISKADLLADAKKGRWEMLPRVDCYWLAVPKELEDEAVKRAVEIGAGVFVVHRANFELLCEKIREPKRWLKKDVVPHLFGIRPDGSTAQRRGDIRNKVWRLAAMRYWDAVFYRCTQRTQPKKENQ